MKWKTVTAGLAFNIAGFNAKVEEFMPILGQNNASTFCRRDCRELAEFDDGQGSRRCHYPTRTKRRVQLVFT